MKAIVLALFLCGCAETRVYDRGILAAIIQGDAINVTINTEHGSFHADSLNHSVPTTSAYNGAAKVTGAVGTAVAGALMAR